MKKPPFVLSDLNKPVLGEITVGPAFRRVTPRMIAGVDAWKRAMSVCLEDDCSKIDGHDGPCTPRGAR